MHWITNPYGSLAALRDSGRKYKSCVCTNAKRRIRIRSESTVWSMQSRRGPRNRLSEELVQHIAAPSGQAGGVDRRATGRMPNQGDPSHHGTSLINADTLGNLVFYWAGSMEHMDKRRRHDDDDDNNKRCYAPVTSFILTHMGCMPGNLSPSPRTSSPTVHAEHSAPVHYEFPRHARP